MHCRSSEVKETEEANSPHGQNLQRGLYRFFKMKLLWEKKKKEKKKKKKERKKGEKKRLKERRKTLNSVILHWCLTTGNPRK